MSRSKIGHVLPIKITDKIVTKHISQALRHQHVDMVSAIKNISQVTGIGTDTAAKWYKGKNPPKSAHLLILAACYPCVLQALCDLMGRGDIWNAILHENIPQRMQARLAEKNFRYGIRGDKFVTPNTVAAQQIDIELNQRQLWFLEQLQQGHKLQTKDIMVKWGIHKRTAKRDVAALSTAGWVAFVPSGNAGWYVVR